MCHSNVKVKKQQISNNSCFAGSHDVCVCVCACVRALTFINVYAHTHTHTHTTILNVHAASQVCYRTAFA